MKKAIHWGYLLPPFYFRALPMRVFEHALRCKFSRDQDPRRPSEVFFPPKTPPPPTRR